MKVVWILAALLLFSGAVLATTGLSSLNALAGPIYFLTGVTIVAGIVGAIVLYWKYRKVWVLLLAPVIGVVSAAVVALFFVVFVL